MVSDSGTAVRSYLVGPIRAQDIRRKAISFFVLGLLMKVYWGGYGPWPVVEIPVLSNLRTILEPLFLYGGLLAYIVGWILNRV